MDKESSLKGSREVPEVFKIYRHPNQSILREINPEYLLERLMLKLNFQYFGFVMQRADSLKKTLMLGED